MIWQATFAALGKPGQWSTGTRSLSTVFGMPMKRLLGAFSAAHSASASTVSMESLPPM